MELGETLKQIRLSDGKFNQKSFAKLIGSSQSHLCSVENGKRKPSIDLIEEYVKRFKVPTVMVIFLSLTEENIPKKKIEAFRTLKPMIDNLIKDLFNINEK